MISRTKTGRSFGGLARYLVQGHKDQQQGKQSKVLAAEGVRTDTVEHMIADFNRGRKVNPGLGQAVWHTSLSFNPDDSEKLDSDKMREIAEDYMQEMGLVGTQYAIIRHRDTPGHEHLHIVANRVADDGHTISDKKNFYRSTEALVKLIQKYELTPPQGLRPEKQKPTQLHGAELTKYQIRQVLAATLATATQWNDLHPALAAEQITYKTFLNAAGEPVGISFEKDGLTFKGSEIGRQYSFSGIGKQTAANRQAQGDEVVAQLVPVISIDQAPPLVAEGASRPAPQVVPAEVPARLMGQVLPEAADVAQRLEQLMVEQLRQQQQAIPFLAALSAQGFDLVLKPNPEGTGQVGVFVEQSSGVAVPSLALKPGGWPWFDQVQVPTQQPAAQLVPVPPKPAAPEQRPVATQPPAPESKPALKPELPAPAVELETPKQAAPKKKGPRLR
jgi:Relaxase/Mobilisation nuclease domain